MEKNHPGLDDLFVTTLTAKTVRGIGNFEMACIPLQTKVKKFKTEKEAKTALLKFGYINEDGEPSKELKNARITKVEIIEARVA